MSAATAMTCGGDESRDLNEPRPVPSSEVSGACARAHGKLPLIECDSSNSVLIVAACPLTPRAAKIEIRPCGVLSHPNAVVNHASFGRHSKPFTRRAASGWLKKKGEGGGGCALTKKLLGGLRGGGCYSQGRPFSIPLGLLGGKNLDGSGRCPVCPMGKMQHP